MSADTEQAVAEIFRAVFGVDAGTDVSGFSPETRGDWDSLAHVTIMTALESELGVELEPAEMLRLNSYRSIVEHLRDRAG